MSKSVVIAFILFLIVNVMHGIYFANHLQHPIALFYLHAILFAVHGIILLLFLLFYKRYQFVIGFSFLGLILVKLVVLKFWIGNLLETYQISQKALFVLPPYVVYIVLLMTFVINKLANLKISTKSDP